MLANCDVFNILYTLWHEQWHFRAFVGLGDCGDVDACVKEIKNQSKKIRGMT